MEFIIAHDIYCVAIVTVKFICLFYLDFELHKPKVIIVKNCCFKYKIAKKRTNSRVVVALSGYILTLLAKGSQIEPQPGQGRL